MVTRRIVEGMMAEIFGMNNNNVGALCCYDERTGPLKKTSLCAFTRSKKHDVLRQYNV